MLDIQLISSNVFPLRLKQTFPPLIWICTEGEGDGIESRIPFKIFSTLLPSMKSGAFCQLTIISTYQSIFQVDSHETKLEELEVLVKSQAELIQELKSKQVELTSALDTKQVELEAAIAEQKVQAAQELSDVKVALEQSQDQAKVSLAHQLEQLRDRGEERQVGLACKTHLKQLQIQITDSWSRLFLNKSLINATNYWQGGVWAVYI